MDVSEQALEGLIEKLNTIIAELTAMADGISNFSSVTREWNDEVGSDLNMEMQRIANLVEDPVQTLQKCIKKLEAVLGVIHEYNSLRRNA